MALAESHGSRLPLVLSGRIQSVQAVFNIFDPTPLDCLITICVENDVAVLARCVLDEGGLTGFFSPETAFISSEHLPVQGSTP